LERWLFEEDTAAGENADVRIPEVAACE
jgi:hypothetical protein